MSAISERPLPTPLRALAKRGLPPFEESIQEEQLSSSGDHRKELRALCTQLQEKRHEAEQRAVQLECELAAARATALAAEEKLHEAEHRAAQLERELAAARAITLPAEGTTSSVIAADDSPGFAKLHAEAKRACRETASIWQALESRVDSPVFRALRKQDAAVRAIAEAKLERRARTALWEALQEAVDGATVVAVAQGISFGREEEPVLPVHIARRLFEVSPHSPEEPGSGRPSPDGNGATSTPKGVGRLSVIQRSQVRTASLPVTRSAMVSRQQEKGPAIQTALTPSSKVRDRVRALEMSGHRRPSLGL